MGLMSIFEDVLAIKKDNDILQKLEERGFNIEKIDSDSFIGRGFFNVVYNVDDKYALKINEGELNWHIIRKESKAYSKLVGENFNNVAKVYYAETINSIKKSVVVMELLERDWSVRKIFKTDNKVDYRGFKYDTFKAYTRFYHYEYKQKQEPFEKIFTTFSSSVLDENFIYYIKQEYEDKAMEILEQTHNGINELRSLGIEPNDVHINNIMKDPSKGTYKIIDFIS